MDSSQRAPALSWSFPLHPPSRSTTPNPLEVNTNLSRPLGGSPIVRTPSRLRAHTLAAIPRTPVKICTDFPVGLWDGKEQSAVEENERPGSASSTHSQSSNFSSYSLASGGGSCTSPEDDASTFVYPPAKEEKQEVTSDDAVWTKEMDDHLWRTYTMYQQDARMTPFYVVPGSAPPLGVCCRVVRAAKKTWRQSRMEEGVAYPKTSPKARIPRITIGDEDVPKSPKKSPLPFDWPASESASRKRLRILCKTQYGPPVTSQHRQLFSFENRGPVRRSRRHQSEDISSLSSFRSSLDSGFSTRDVQFSLITSTSTTMRPDGVLASWSAGIDEQSSAETELPPIISAPHTPHTIPPVAAMSSPLPSIAHSPVFPEHIPAQRPRAGSLMLERAFVEPAMGSPLLPGLGESATSSETPRALLPPLELKASSSPFATWPRRRRRRTLPAEEVPSSPKSPIKESSQETTPIPSLPPPAARRSVLSNIFGESPNRTPAEESTPKPPPIVRNRGFTLSGPAPRRRLNTTADTPYRHHRSSESLSGISRFLTIPEDANSAPPETPSRLGSPFRERAPSLRNRLVKSNESLGVRIADFFGPAIPPRRSSLGKGFSPEGERPVKRMRE